MERSLFCWQLQHAQRPNKKWDGVLTAAQPSGRLKSLLLLLPLLLLHLLLLTASLSWQDCSSKALTAMV
jgi:hypothetical protein